MSDRACCCRCLLAQLSSELLLVLDKSSCLALQLLQAAVELHHLLVCLSPDMRCLQQENNVEV